MTAPAVSQRRASDAHDLYMALSSWRSDNLNDRRVEYRWLAAQLGSALSLASAMHRGGVDALPPEARRSIAEFEIAELEMKRAGLADDQRKLDQQITRLRQILVSKAAAA